MSKAQVLPLYKEAQQQVEIPRHQFANGGLWFDKFASEWKQDQGVWEFNTAGSEWLSNQEEGLLGDGNLIDELAERQLQFARGQGGKVLAFKNTSRFAAGLGRQHPLENGLTWHQTLGTPYLPASSLKGIIRSWYHENEIEEIEKRFGGTPTKENNHSSFVGDFIFLDLIPRKTVKLVVDVMTPHYSDYYQGGEIPGDWLSPNPIKFMTVEKGGVWQVAVIPRTETAAEKLNEVETALTDALIWAGAGSKTAVGYGRFERLENEEQKMQDELEEKLAKQKAQKEAEAKEQQELEELPEDVRELRQKARDEKWSDTDKSKVKEGLKIYLETHETISKQAAMWWKEKIFDKNNPDMWNDPDAPKWQKKKKKKEWADWAKELKKRSGL